MCSPKLVWNRFMDINRSIILSLFWGQQRSMIQCSLCGNQSTKFEPLSHLSVPVPANVKHDFLGTCIELYTAADIISGWTCPNCSSSTKATKTDIWRLPPVLVIHLQRFCNDVLSWRKNTADIRFPVEQLDMSPYISSEETLGSHAVYHLHGVVNHVGSMETGHYTALCRNFDTGQWRRFDENRCTIWTAAPCKVPQHTCYRIQLLSADFV